MTTLHLDPPGGPPIVIVEAPDPTPPPIVINGYRADPDSGPGADPWPDASIWDGQKIANAYHRKYNRFLTTLRGLDVITRAQWAVEYSAYMSQFNTTRTPLTAAHVLRVWDRALSGTINFPPRAA